MLDLCAFSVGIYCVASTIEWIIHRHIMHSSEPDKQCLRVMRKINRTHLLHHNATFDDMTVKPIPVETFELYELPTDNHRFQNIYFLWSDTIGITVLFLLFSPMVNCILGLVCGLFMNYEVC